MLMIVEKGIKGGIFHPIHRYVKEKNKYIKNYYKSKASSYLIIQMEKYCMDVNNLKIISKDSHNLHSDLPFLSKRIKN